MNLIATDFQRRYEPNFAWGNVMSMYQQLPGLIGFWPGNVGTTTSGGLLRDMSGAGLHLTAGVVNVEAADTTGLRRWNTYNGTTQYASIADAAFNSIIGTESAINSTIRGLTVMAWVRPTSGTGSYEAVIGKFKTAGDERSWVLRRKDTGHGQFIANGSGPAANNVAVQSTNTLDADEWRFVAGRYTPSTQVRIWEGFTYGLVTNENTTSVPATLFDSTGDLSVGAVNTSGTAANFWSGDLSLIALCRAALPDLFIESIFNLTRPLFIRR